MQTATMNSSPLLLMLLLLPLLLLLLPAVGAAPSISISVSPSYQPRLGEKIRVTCQVSGLNSDDYFRFKVSFNCPVVRRDPSVPCFQDCKHTCSPGMGCSGPEKDLVSRITCQTYRGTDKLQFDYSFVYNSDAYAGDYRCQFWGKTSVPVNMPRPKRPPTTTPRSTASTTKSTATTTATTTKRPRKPTTPPSVLKPPVGGSVNVTVCVPGPTSTPVMDPNKERTIAALMVLLIVSVGFNIIFCVRVSLLAHYDKHPSKKRRMSTLLCLTSSPQSEPMLPQGSIRLASSLVIGDDAGGSDSTYSVPSTSHAAYLPIGGGHGRANTLPVLSGGDSQKVVFIPVIASSMNTLHASHQRLNSSLPDTVSLGATRGGAGGVIREDPMTVAHPPPAVPSRESLRAAQRNSNRLSATSVQLRHKSGQEANGTVIGSDPPYDRPPEETLIE